MNERIKEFMRESGVKTFFPGDPGSGAPGPEGVYFGLTETQKLEKFAELIVRECTGVLFDESEKLSALYSDEDNWQSAEEYEIRSDQCVDNIAVIEKHFGVE
jgi:hypothetical protein